MSLPLAGGGAGSIEQMRDFVGIHAHSFGLIRLTFGVGSDAMTRHMFVHASDDIDSGKFSAVERGKAMSVAPAMEKAMRAFVNIAATVHVKSPEECTADNFL